MSGKAIWNAALAYGAQFNAGADLNSLAAGSCAVSSTVYDNTTNLYTDAWVCCEFPTLATGTGAPSLDVYLLPLNQDGTTYGDGTASGTVAPASCYRVGSITWQPSLPSGTQVGSIQLPSGLPPTKFKLAVVNNIGNALAAASNIVALAPANLNLNG